MDSRRLSFPVDRPRVHSAGLSSPPPLLITTTTSPPACLRRRRLVSPPIWLVGHTTVVGRLRLHHRPASVAADWCLRLHGWPIMPLLLGVYDFTAGLPPSPPSGASAYTAGLLCRCCWASTSSPPACLRRRRLVPPSTRLAYYAAAVGRLRFHRRLASVAAEWCLRLHGWPIMPPLLGVYDFTAGLPPSPPSGSSAYTAGLLCRRCWASTTSPPACLRRRRVVPPPTRLAYYAAAVGRLRLHRRPASVAAEWCLRLHGWPIMPPLLGVHDFTAGLPSLPPSGASAYTAGLLCRRCWASTTSPPARLRRRRLESSPIRVIAYTVGRSHHRSWASMSSPTGWPSSAADWCFRLHGWPIMLPLLGVYVFTDRLAFAAADWCFRLHGWPLCRRCWASTSSPTGLPSPLPTGVSACTAGLLCCRCWASTSSPTGLPSPPPTGVHTCTAGLLCRRCWAPTSTPPACLRRRRLVSSPIRLGASACTAGLLCCRCWASTSSPTGLPSPPPTGCFRLHGWPIMPPLVGIFAFTVDRLRRRRLGHHLFYSLYDIFPFPLPHYTNWSSIE
uniref:cysteine dioxygenase n=1 Tax=Oryza sativa subsp. japonica TaxID=39947 RepID=Q69L74_ORYSJ|nr:HGWP repeat containing protein-like [Oryza sativa Japonica Group]